MGLVCLVIVVKGRSNRLSFGLVRLISVRYGTVRFGTVSLSQHCYEIRNAHASFQLARKLTGLVRIVFVFRIRIVSQYRVE